MTSLLLKKHRTTRPSTARSSRPKRRLLAGLLVFGSFGGAITLVSADDAGSSQASAVLEVGSRLDASSAEKRWEQLRATYLGHHERRNETAANANHPASPASPEPATRPVTTRSITASDDGSLSISAGPEQALTENPFEVISPVQHAAVETAAGTVFEATPVSGSTADVHRLFDAENNRANVSLPATEANSFQMPVVSERPFEFSRADATWTADDVNLAPVPMAPLDTSIPETASQPAAIISLPNVSIGDETAPSQGSISPLTAEQEPVGRAQLDLTGPEPADLTPEPAVNGPDISQRLKLKPLSSIVPSAGYAPSGEDACSFTCPTPAGCPDDESSRCPDDIALPSNGSVDRYYAESMYHWAATNQVYNPLYFEDVRLERYGQHIPEPLQSLKSVGLFAAQFASLPYQMAIDPVHECVSPLGFYRPGEAAPCLKRAIPFNGKAAATAAGVYTGLIFLIP